MVGVAAANGAESIVIVGHGLSMPAVFSISPGISLQPDIPQIDMNDAAKACANFREYASVVGGNQIASFSLLVEGETGAALTAKAWNALWLFHLLSLAAESPCCSLFTVSNGETTSYASANRNSLIIPFEKISNIDDTQIEWAQKHFESFEKLIGDDIFSAAMRAYGNSQYLFDLDLRIMLIWSGIEGLLSVDSELTRRLALYTALMIEGNDQEKIQWFKDVKKAYSIRSKAVHGGSAKLAEVAEGYRLAKRILIKLLRRCVEIGRVPTSAELDAIAVTATLR